MARNDQAERYRISATTLIRYGQLGLVAFILDGYAPTVQLLAKDLHSPLFVASFHGTTFGVGFIAGSFAASLVTARLGRSLTITIGVAGLVVGLIAYLVSPIILASLISIGVCGAFCSLVQSAAYADLADTDAKTRRHVLNEGAALSQVAGISAPLLVGIASTLVIGWRGGLGVAAIFAIYLLIIDRGYKRQRDNAPKVGLPHIKTTLRASRVFWIAWISMVVVLGIEFSMSMWAPIYLKSHFNASTALATLSPSIMLSGIFIGRLIASRLAPFFRADVLLCWSTVLSMGGFAIFWSSSMPVLAFCGLAFTGLGIAAQFPLSLARLTAASNGNPDVASALGSVALGLAIAVSPFLLGILDHFLGVQLALLLIPTLGIFTIGLVLVSRTRA